MKRLKRIFIFIFMLFIITGCVKMDISMTVNKDKSMNVTIIEAIDESLASQGDTEILTEEDKKEFEEIGFTVEDYNEEGMVGAKIYRDIKNIDEVSKEEEVEFSLDFSDEEENYMFQVKKGFFKNTYKAKIESLDADSLTEDITGSDDTTTDDFDSYDDYDYDYSYDDYDYTSDDTTSDYDLSDFDYDYLLSSMDLKMKINLPYKALSNNATTVENDGKNLIWDLTKVGDTPIEFEFELYNIGNIILVGAGALVIIVILVIVLIKKKGKKNKTAVQPQPTASINNPVPNNNIPNQMSNNMLGGTLAQNNNINEQNLQQQSLNNVQTNSFVDTNNQGFIPTNSQPLANDTSNASVQQNSFIQPAPQEFIQPTPEPLQTTNMPTDNSTPNVQEQKNNSIDDLFNMVPVQESNQQTELNNNQPTPPTVPEETNNIPTQNDALTGNVVPEIQPTLPAQPETTNDSTNLSNVPTENQTLQPAPQVQPLEQNNNTMNFNNILSENQNNQNNQIFPQ